MSSAEIRDLTNSLPRSMQEAVEGYVDAVKAALPDIQREAAVKIEARNVNEFLLVVAIRRIWAAVNSQYWTMHDCIDIASRPSIDISAPQSAPVRGFRLGGEEISATSEPFRQSRVLRTDMERVLVKLEIQGLVKETTSLAELARRMFGTTS